MFVKYYDIRSKKSKKIYEIRSFNLGISYGFTGDFYNTV
ncbi:hypothetical protein ENHYD8BJ_440002 [Enhydrobacter sp. 8BJ]|nr:hypothetical protein ENHYD8BJ_440002 [Enhydrobacter sp. 8BJ]